MEVTPSESRKPHIEIANWLFVRLAAVLVVTTVASAILTAGMGMPGFVLGTLVSLLALWLVVHFVFEALNDLLEAKLDGVT